MPTIALQLYTVREALNHDLDGGLAAIAAMGYTHVELAGLYGGAAEQLKAKLDANGLTAVAGHDAWITDTPDPTTAIETARVFGYGHVVQPFWPDDKRTAAGYAQIADAINAQNIDGITFAYHNHDFEFQTLDDGRTGFDVIFDNTGVTAELDTCWAVVAGIDTPALIAKLAGRLPLIHVKDCRDLAAKTLTEIGTGVVPIKDILAAATDAGTEYFVVEQDNNWIDGDPLKSAQISLENLKGMLG
ncbi:MAG: sugar phosphate isomerase/epimerase [Planctomycetota bacterium]